MISDSLHDVSRILRIKIVHRQPEKFGKKIRNQRNIDTGIDVQRNPVLHKPDQHLADRQNQLENKNDDDKVEIVIRHSNVNHRLCKKREYQFQYQSEHDSTDNLHQQPPVWAQILHEPLDGLFLLFSGCLVIKGRSRSQHQHHSLVLPFLSGRNPAVHKFLDAIFYQAECRVGYIHLSLISSILLLYLYFIDHHKMVLPPMHDAGQNGFLCQFLKRGTDAQRFKADCFRTTGNAQHSYSVTVGITQFTQLLKRIYPFVILHNHAQTRWPAVHRIVLQYYRKSPTQLVSSIKLTS